MNFGAENSRGRNVFLFQVNWWDPVTCSKACKWISVELNLSLGKIVMEDLQNFYPMFSIKLQKKPILFYMIWKIWEFILGNIDVDTGIYYLTTNVNFVNRKSRLWY